MNIGIIGLPQVGKKTFVELLTGKDYVVEDGDIMRVRFNV